MNDKPDTRLTDYALGELDDVARAELQEQLADDDAARAEADEIAGLGDAMRRATVRPHASVEERNALLQDIIHAHLESQAERAAAEAAAEPVALPPSGGWSRKTFGYVGAAVAASLLIAAAILPQFQPLREFRSGSAKHVMDLHNVPSQPGADGGVDNVAIGGDSRYENGSGPIEFGSKWELKIVPPAGPEAFASLSSGPPSVLGGVMGAPGLGAATDPTVAGPPIRELLGNGDRNRMQLQLQSQTPSPLAFNRSNSVTYDGVISGNGAVNLGPPPSSLVITNTAGVTLNGAPAITQNLSIGGNVSNSGTLMLSGNNTYAGVTTIASGATLNLGEGGTAAPIIVNGTVASAGQHADAPKKYPSLGMPGADRRLKSSALFNVQTPADPRVENGRIAATPPGPKTFAGVLYPLLLEHEKLVAQYGPKHPRVAELELKVNMVQQHLERDLGSKVAAELASNAPPSEDRLIALLIERRRFAAMYGASHPKTKELDTKYRTEQARYDEFRRSEAAAVAAKQNTEAYDSIVENPFVRAIDTPLSTFSIDVDTASYSNVRRFLNQGQLPPRGAVRIEEFLNYFTYSYPQPKGTDPFSITTEAARCPWNADNVLVRVGLKGRTIHTKERPATNLVFLVDVSGSMQSPDKLPLVRESLKMLVRELGDNDRVAIVVYAGNTGLVLPSTGGNEKPKILAAISGLEAGGSTNGGAGIQLAYEIAVENFIKGGVNRVVLATDGDFNVGITNQSDLVDLIEAKAKTGVFFSGLAYGTGNLKDATLEKLADKGNGNYSYIDSLAEARKVLVDQMSATLVTIAKDVKVQIEFNPARVEAYRLIGYENRVLAAQDFNDDKKDAGEIGAGHTVTALYEVVPVRINAADVLGNIGLPAIDPLKYQKPKAKPKLEPTEASKANELLTLKLRYKQPDGDVSKLIERPLKNEVKDYPKASGDFKFAAAVASFGMQLRDSQYRGTATFDAVLELAQEGIGRDDGGYRREFIELVRKARELKPQSTQP